MYTHGRKTHASALNTPHTPDHCSNGALTQRRHWHSLGPVLAQALPHTTLSNKRGGEVTLYMQGGGLLLSLQASSGCTQSRENGEGGGRMRSPAPANTAGRLPESIHVRSTKGLMVSDLPRQIKVQLVTTLAYIACLSPLNPKPQTPTRYPSRLLCSY